jgi:hypothetical protein
LAYPDDVNIVDENIDTIKKNTEALRCQYGDWSGSESRENERYQRAGQKHSIKRANRSFGDVAKSKIFKNNTNRSEMHARRD